MQSIALVMKRKLLAEGIAGTLKNDFPDIQTHIISNYGLTGAYTERYKPDIAAVEVSESGPYTVEYCLSLCGEIKKLAPSCKLILICPETDKEVIAQAVSAKRNQLIDDFVFYDSCLDYLVSKMVSL